MTPETQYARSGSVHLAYQVLGTGPPDLLLVDQWFSNMDSQWDIPPLAEFHQRLASFGRLVMFDKRGSGLSDPTPTSALPTMEEWMLDVPVVLDAVGSERAALITNLAGGLMATMYAAAHPERVTSLILVDCFARMLAAPDFPIGGPREGLERSVLDAEGGAWGRGMMLDRFAPSVASDDRLRRSWSRYERQSASPGTAARIIRQLLEGDVRGVLPVVRVPTLVIARTNAQGYGVDHGRYLAEHIPNARYVELPGVDSLIWAGDQDAMVAEIQGFVTGVRPMPTPRRVLATILFTDIVGSTSMAATMGDERWRSLLDEHYRLTRQQLDRWGGREIKTVGDGILATFDGPARGVRCAMAIRDAVRTLGLEVRAGLHTGEIELEPDDIAGIAVHIGARISALADGGEVLVSGTVRDLIVGSGLEFIDHGARELKGVPGEWRVFALAP